MIFQWQMSQEADSTEDMISFRVVGAVEIGASFWQEGFAVILFGSGCVNFSSLSIHEIYFMSQRTLFGFVPPWRPVIDFAILAWLFERCQKISK